MSNRRFAVFGTKHGETLLESLVGPRGHYAKYGKRIFDIVVATFGAVIASPIAVILAALVHATSPGPLLFRQLRVGKGGQEFELVKFRNMYLYAESQPGTRWAASDDPRITSIWQVVASLSPR